MAQEPSVEEKTMIIGVTFPASTETCWVELKQEMVRQAEDLEVELLICEADSLDAQRSDIEAFLARPVDGLVVYPVTATVEDLGISALDNLKPHDDCENLFLTDAPGFAQSLLFPLVESLTGQRAVPFEIGPPDSQPSSRALWRSGPVNGTKE